MSPIYSSNLDGTLDETGGTEGNFAWQAIVGFAVPLNEALPGLAATADGSAIIARRREPHLPSVL